MPIRLTRTISLLGFRPWGDLGGLTAYTTRRRRTVWFLKSPPRKTPSPAQLQTRNMMRQAAEAWRAIGPIEREKWNSAVRRTNSPILGYHAWVRYQRKRDQGELRTLERNSGLKLILTPPANA